MAADSDVIAADAVDLQLEAMRTNDYSWHPCQVHLSPNGAGLVIKYGNNGSKDTLVNEKEALTRLRVRSLPLQDDDCAHITEGKHVVVSRNSESESCFFDAEVEKVARVRHSKRTGCRCTFMIKWLHQDLHGGSLTVPSSSIMILANKSITNHPTISAFIDAVSLSNSSFSGMSPQLNIVNDIDLDLHDLLEKQIEGIRNSVNGSKKKIRDEILVLEANTDEQVKAAGLPTSKAREPETQILTNKSHLRRSNRSQKTEVKHPPSPPVIPSPSTEDELPDNRSPLNPLAARAALASLMSKLPQSLDFSLEDNERKGFPDSCAIDGFSTVNKLPPETKAAPKPVINNSLDMSLVLKVSSKVRVQKVESVPDDNIEKTGNKSRRFTRSLLHKEAEKESTEIDSVPSTRSKIVFKMEEESKGSAKKSSDTRKLTRSLANKEAANTKTESVKELDVNMLKTKGEKKREFAVETDRRSTNGDGDSLPSEQRIKKRNTSGVALTIQDSEGNVMANGGSRDGSKKNSINLKKQEVRSSPRLARSQNKV